MHSCSVVQRKQSTTPKPTHITENTLTAHSWSTFLPEVKNTFQSLEDDFKLHRQITSVKFFGLCSNIIHYVTVIKRRGGVFANPPSYFGGLNFESLTEYQLS